MKPAIQTIISGLLMMIAAGANATTLTYTLDQSNRLADGIDYVSVTLSKDTTTEYLSVNVELLDALDGFSGEHTGIQAFAFNLHDDVRIGRDRHPRWGRWGGRMHRYGFGGFWGDPGWCRLDDMPRKDDVLTPGDFDLPKGWRARLNRGRWGMPSMYDALVFGRRNNQDPLQFMIDGLSVEDISNEFAVLVTGLDLGGDECVAAYSSHGHHGHCNKRRTSALFYGGNLAPIPIPASFWLLGSGLLGLVGMARRRRTS